MKMPSMGINKAENSAFLENPKLRVGRSPFG
jgi:hypothetical protein